jgi:hypothetical protein
MKCGVDGVTTLHNTFRCSRLLFEWVWVWRCIVLCNHTHDKQEIITTERTIQAWLVLLLLSAFPLVVLNLLVLNQVYKAESSIGSNYPASVQIAQRSHDSPSPLISILRQKDPFQYLPLHFLNKHFNIILSSLSKWSLPCMFSNQDVVHLCPWSILPLIISYGTTKFCQASYVFWGLFEYSKSGVHKSRVPGCRGANACTVAPGIYGSSVKILFHAILLAFFRWLLNVIHNF